MENIRHVEIAMAFAAAVATALSAAYVWAGVSFIRIVGNQLSALVKQLAPPRR